MPIDRTVIENKVREWTAQKESLHREYATLQERSEQIAVALHRIDGALNGLNQILIEDKPRGDAT
jgi:hypothetical protein